MKKGLKMAIIVKSAIKNKSMIKGYRAELVEDS